MTASESRDGTEELTDQGTIAGGPPALSVGDKVLWDNRSMPLTIIEAAHEVGEHSEIEQVAAEGPRGGVVTLEKSLYDHKWSTTADGRVSRVVIVEPVDDEPLSAGRDEPVTTAWSGPTSDCPFCGDEDRFRSQDFRCHFLDDATYGGDERPIERTDSGDNRVLVRAECTTCGGVVYEHPAFAQLFASDFEPVEFPPEFDG